MLQADRKTEAVRETAREQKTSRQKQTRENKTAPAAALEALLAGQSLGQLPAESVLALSHSLGNSALLELLSARGSAAEPETRPLPAGPCGTDPVNWGGGGPALAEPPAFAAMAPMGSPAPMAV